MNEITPRVVSWFSCGNASATATVKALEKYGYVQAVYCRVIEEHEDNLRFIVDFTKATGIPIEIITNEKHGGSIYSVFEARKFIKNQYGAPCTMELKRDMRKQYQLPTDIQILGFTSEEGDRIDSFIDANNEVNADFILSDLGINKEACHQFIADLGIPMPVMYQLGYQNNNCIGCVKGGMGYFNKIRKDFPVQFNKLAVLERKLGFAINKDKNGMVFLDQLDPNRGNYKDDAPAVCGFVCEHTPTIL